MNQDDMLDCIKYSVMIDPKNANAFMGSLLCNIEWVWSTKIPTAATNYKQIMLNLGFLSSLSPNHRLFVALHEIQHIIRLHDLRLENRDPRIWNLACDYLINYDLHKSGYSVPANAVFSRDLLIQNNLTCEEEIYDFLLANNPELAKTPIKSFGVDGEDGDLQKSSEAVPDNKSEESHKRELLEAVKTAATAAKLNNEAGVLPGKLEQLLDSFLNPTIPWNQALRKYFVEKDGTIKHSWSRRNRRQRHAYMPSRVKDTDALAKIMFFLDTSASSTDEDLQKFTSEIKFVQENLNPLEIIIVQFDHDIQHIDKYKKGDKIPKLTIYGRGGTSLNPVRKIIEDEQPTVSVIFSDLECYPMEKPKTPVIWITKKTVCSWQPDYGAQYFTK